jgi:hypothetical protein
MLSTFEIEGFRTFSHLNLGRLGQVNLLVGRNGVGKSTLLEALQIYGAGGHPEVLLQLLLDRDEVLPWITARNGAAEPRLRFESLFHSYGSPSRETQVQNGPPRIIRLRAEGGDPSGVRIQVERFHRVLSDGEPRRVEFKLLPAEAPTSEVDIPALTAYLGDTRRFFLRLDEGDRSRLRRTRPEQPMPGPAFISATKTDFTTIGRQWDSIALHDSEERVTECLRLLAPVERITSIEHPARRYGRDERIFLARMSGVPGPVSLKSLGDGMLHMFQIALALESATGEQRAQPPLFPDLQEPPAPRFLLIDEVENGIHYKLLPKVWEFIFGAARLRGIQVFATTHSWDCLEAFQVAASRNPDVDGMAIRLERDKEGNRAVLFDQKELEIVTRDNIEMR